MSLPITIVCPLGSECEKIGEGAIERCAWYTEIAGTTPDGEQVDEWRCSMAWLPTLLVENAMTNRGQTSAIESMRNETTDRQDILNKIIYDASQQNKRLE